MPFTSSDGPAIYYETIGNPADAPIVLISGAGAQLIWWRDEIVQRLLDRGLFVIRFDNRDVGKSAKLGRPNDAAAAYAVADMAHDVCRVLDDLGIASAHIAGQSLGGIISQLMAINHPARVRSMVLFYTVPAFEQQYVGDALQRGILTSATTAGEAPLTREQTIEQFIAREDDTRSPAYDFDDVWMRSYVTECVDRGYCPGGILRQAQAAMAIGDLRPGLRELRLPTAVIHGRADRLLKVAAGFEIAQVIPDAELHIYPGMGHEFPRPLWDDFANIIARTTQRAAATQVVGSRP